MQESYDIVTTLDLTGLKCPLPVLKARRAVKATVSYTHLTLPTNREV